MSKEFKGVFQWPPQLLKSGALKVTIVPSEDSRDLNMLREWDGQQVALAPDTTSELVVGIGEMDEPIYQKGARIAQEMREYLHELAEYEANVAAWESRCSDCLLHKDNCDPRVRCPKLDAIQESDEVSGD